jgi:probable rRNA maturation factor
MIVLDPDMDPESPHGRRPVHGDTDTALKATSAKRATVSGTAQKPRDVRLPSARTLARFLNEAQRAVRLKGQVTVLLTTDAAIKKLNRQFRGKNQSTDVLSFPAQGVGAEEMAGDLAISVTTALGQAAEQGHSLSTEIKILILHGLLHLAGYDHEADDGKMARRERLLRGRLGLLQGLIERAGEDAIPQGPKPKNRLGTSTARLKSCPDTSSIPERVVLRAMKPRASKATNPSGAKAPADSVAVLRGLKPPPPSGPNASRPGKARKRAARSKQP